MRKKIEIEVMGLEEIKELTRQEKAAEKAALALAKAQMLAATAAERLAKATAQTASVTQSANDKSAIAAAKVGVETAKAAAIVQNSSNQTTATVVKNAAIVQQATAKTALINTQAANSTIQLGIAATNAATAQGRLAVAQSNSALSAGRLALAQDKFNQSLVQGTSSSQGFFASFLRYQLLSRVFGELTKAASESVQAMIEIDKQAARVARVTNHGDRGIAGASIASDSARSGLDFKTVGEGYYQLTTQLGNVRDASGAMQTAMNLVVGTESDMRDTTRALSQIYYEFGGQLDQSVGKVENFRRVGEAMAITYKITNTEVSELTSSLKYLAPIAAAARVAPEQIFAIVGALDKAGIRGSMAGTGPSSFISNVISKYDDKLGGIVSGKNIATFKKERNADGGQDVIKTLQNIISVAEQLGRTDTSKAEKFLQTVSGSQRSFRFVGAIAALKDAMNDMVNLQGKVGEALHKGGTHYAEDLAKEMKDTFSNKIATAWQSTLGVMGTAWNNFAKGVHLNGLLDDIAKAQQGMLDIEKLNQSTSQGFVKLRNENKSAFAYRTKGDVTNAISHFSEKGGNGTFQISELLSGNINGVTSSEGKNIAKLLSERGAVSNKNAFGVDTSNLSDLLKLRYELTREVPFYHNVSSMENDERLRNRKPTAPSFAKGGLGTKPAKGDGGRGAERLALDMSSLDEDIIRLRDGEDAAKLFRINSEYRREMAQDPRRANLHRSLLLGELAKERTEKARKEAEDKADERRDRADRSYEIRRTFQDGGESADLFDTMRSGLAQKNLSFQDRLKIVATRQKKAGAIGLARVYEQLGDNPFGDGGGLDFAASNMNTYNTSLRKLGLGFRGNALGTSENDELSLLGAKRNLASDALQQAQDRHETENVVKFTEALEDAEKALTDFKDNLEKQKYQRRIEGIGDRASNSLFELEMSQGVVGTSGAYGQSVASARARVGIYARQRDERARAYVFSPESQRDSNFRLWEDSVKEFRRASKELAELPLRRFIEQKEQVQGVLTGGIVNFLRGKGSLGAGFAGAGDMIVNKALENQINKWFDPVADAATKQILALDANTQALLALPTQMQGAIAGTSGAGSASMGIPALVAAGAAAGVSSAFGGANGDGKAIPELTGRKTVGKNAAGKYLAAYSVFNQGMEQGASVGGVISGAMAGAQVGGVPGAIIGGLTNLIGGLFHHKKQDPLENRNNWNFGSQNAPDRFFYEAYRFKVTNKMPTAAQLGMTNTDYKPPVVNIYIDGKKAMDSQISKSINGANSSYSTQNFQNVP